MITSKANNSILHIVLVFNPSREGYYNGEKYKGSWDFPGGEFDRKDANLEETAKRELKEELGFKITSELKHFKTSPPGNRATYIAELNVPSSHVDRVNLFRNRSTPLETTDYGFYKRLSNGRYLVTDYSGKLKTKQFITPIVYRQIEEYFRSYRATSTSAISNPYVPTSTMYNGRYDAKAAAFVLPIVYI